MPDVTNPGLVNVADQGDGSVATDQAVQVTPTSSDTSTPALAGGGLGGGAVNVVNPDLVDVESEGGVQGTGLPRSVFVP